MPPHSYKLTYFELRGRGEMIRVIFHAAGVEFEDIRIKAEDWSSMQPKMPWGTLPVLELHDGTTIGQSIAICRYIARQHGLAGANDLESAKCDEYVDALSDFMMEWIRFAWDELDEKKEAGMKEIFRSTSIPKYLSRMEKILIANGSKGRLVGNGLTWADIVVGIILEDIEITVDPKMLEPYPEVKKLRKMVENDPKIKAWLNKRPPEDLVAKIKFIKDVERKAKGLI